MNGYYYFLNRKNTADGFREALNGRYYVDKSEVIQVVNSKISTKEKWLCVTHPRCFEKSMVVEMLASYYTKGCDTDGLFQNLKIHECPTYREHLNAHNVIYMSFSGYF